MRKEIITDILRKILPQLVAGNYEEILKDDYEPRLTTESFNIAMEEYPDKLTMPPEEDLDNVELYEISENEVAFEYDLWANGEKSDLTLLGRVVSNKGEYKYTIEDIHVL